MPLNDAQVLSILGQQPPPQATGGLTDAQVQAMLAQPQAPQAAAAPNPADYSGTLQIGPWDTGLPIGQTTTAPGVWLSRLTSRRPTRAAARN